MIIKRLFDIVFSFLGILLLIPVFLIISVIIISGSRGGIFFKQTRIGKNGKEFKLYKFRTMYLNSEKKGLLTVGSNDNRITKAGTLLRKYKLDELPQLINVLNGSMSFVGPRPEVAKYVNLYNDNQRKILSVRPGITDYASIAYINENEILGKVSDPEKTYIAEIMPAKINLNLQYIEKINILTDIKIIFKTIVRILL